MTETIEEYERVGIEAAKLGGEVIREAFYKPKSITTKSAITDLVTETDQLSEKLIFQHLKQSFPSHSFVGEESVAAANSDEKKIQLTDNPTWVVDPLDGTTNFVHQFPNVVVSIGLLINKEPTVGIIYNPITGELFTGIKGRGAFLRNTLFPDNKPQKLSTSGQHDLGLSLIATEYGSDRSKARMDVVVANCRAVIDNPVHGIRSLGSAATQMAFVAAGRLDGYFEMGIHCWDIAAGTVLVREAGGFVGDTELREDLTEPKPLELLSRRILCAATKELATSVASKLVQIVLPSD